MADKIHEQRIQDLDIPVVEAVEKVKDDDAVSINAAALGDDLPPGYFWSPQFIGMVVGLAFGVIAAYVIFVMSTSILIYINADIGPSPNISWVSIVRTLSQSVGFLIQGRLGDLFGRRWLYVGGNLVALLGIVLCAVSQTVDTMIVANAIYALGECVQISFGAAIGELVPNRVRPMIMSGIFFSSAPFAAFGPIIARKWIDVGIGWRWNFYLGIIIVGIAAVLMYICYHPPTFEMLHERKSKKQLLKDWDYVGMVLWATGWTLFLLGWSWGGGVIAFMVIGGCCIIAFGFYESYANLKYPLMPMSFFPNRGYISLVTIITISSMYYYSAVLLWPQQVSAMLTTDITDAGWVSCTVPASVVLGQGLCAFITKLNVNTRHIMIVASVAMVAFISGLAALTPEKRAMGIALTILGPMLVAFVDTAAIILAPLFCPPEDIGLANGMLASIRAVGSSVAVAVYTTTLTNRLTTTLTDVAGAAAVGAGMSPQNVPALVAGIKSGGAWTKMPFLTPQIVAAVQQQTPTAYGQAFSTVYLASIAFGVISIIAACFVIDARPLLTSKVERRMHGTKIGGAMKTKEDLKLEDMKTYH